MSLNIKNGKVKCVGYHRNERYFTVGKVYDVVNNTIVNDNGFEYKGGYGAIESVIEWLSGWYKWEVVPTEKIVITHDYKTTTATMYRGDEKVVATARCAPEDKFDFMVGAKLAMERLNAKINAPIEPIKPKYYNGKVVCVKSPYRWWTVGKVYEVKDGYITCDPDRWGNVTVYPKNGAEPYRDAEDVRHAGHDKTPRHNYRNEFIPLIEG